MSNILIDDWIFSRLRPQDNIIWENYDFEGKHKYIGNVIEKGLDLIKIKMYDSLISDVYSESLMVFEREDVVDQMYFSGSLNLLLGR